MSTDTATMEVSVSTQTAIRNKEFCLSELQRSPPLVKTLAMRGNLPEQEGHELNPGARLRVLVRAKACTIHSFCVIKEFSHSQKNVLKRFKSCLPLLLKLSPQII